MIDILLLIATEMVGEIILALLSCLTIVLM